MKSTSVVAFSAAALTVVPASAQVLSDERDAIDEIVVTGARTPISPDRLGSSVTVISRDEIERRQVRYLTDVLRSVPGLAISHSGPVGAQTQVRARGSEATHVLVLVDGVRANDPASNDEFRWEHLAATNVERVEIVRGPQSALWGSEAIGAVVNVVSRKGSESSGIDAYVESGSHDTSNLGASLTTAVGPWAIGGGVESLDTRGSNISRAGAEDDGAELSTAALNLSYRDDDRWTFDAGLRAVAATSEFDPIDFASTGLPIDGNLVSDSDSLAAHVDASVATAAGHVWRMRTRYFDSEHLNFVDDVQDSSTTSERVTFGLQSDFLLGENLLIVALEHEETDFRQRGTIEFGSDPNQDQRMRVTSAIGEYQHLSGERLTWILSGRFDKNSHFEDVLTGRLSLTYRWSATTRLRGSIGTGYKTPTFTDRFGFYPEQFIGNPELEPEQSLSVEAGIERDFLDGALSVQATVFQQALEDEINGFVFDPVTFLATAENRPGESERSGIELAAQWQISPRIGIGANYTYTDANEEDDLGQRMTEVRRPENAGSFTLDYASDGDRFRATLAADYGGTRADLFFPPFPEPQEIVTLDSYWLVDLTVQYRISNTMSVFVRGTNLLDEAYEQVYGHRTLGRAGYVGVRAELGR